MQAGKNNAQAGHPPARLRREANMPKVKCQHTYKTFCPKGSYPFALKGSYPFAQRGLTLLPKGVHILLPAAGRLVAGEAPRWHKGRW